jgi:hypothetical protein
MIDRDVALILVGAVIGFSGSIVTTIVGHWLSLREDRIRRERDGEDANRERELAMIERKLGR